MAAAGATQRSGRSGGRWDHRVVANNRMYARCRADGKTFRLAKLWGMSWYIPGEQEAGLGGAWCAYLDEHQGCYSGADGKENRSLGAWFELVYEDAPDTPERELNWRPADGWPCDDAEVADESDRT